MASGCCCCFIGVVLILCFNLSVNSAAFNDTAGGCEIRAESGTFEKISNILKHGTKLIEYRLNYNGSNGLPSLNWTESKAEQIFKPNVWSRVANSHGHTLLSLAFNYNVLSLMTLSFGVNRLEISLIGSPPGCLEKQSGPNISQLLLELVLKDFNSDGDYLVRGPGNFACHQVVMAKNGYAKFTDKCCQYDIDVGSLSCVTDIPNVWLSTLNLLLVSFAVALFLLGPIFITNWIYEHSLGETRYLVKLKEPLKRRVVVFDSKLLPNVKAKRIIDLEDRRKSDERSLNAAKMAPLAEMPDFRKLRVLADILPRNKIIPVTIDEYYLEITSKKLVPEYRVPVGVWLSLTNAVFMCRLRLLPPFQKCCKSSIFGGINKRYEWLDLCSLVGRLLFVSCTPIPFYIRLVLYYFFEYPEILNRKIYANKLGLPEWFEYRILQYLTPTHPMYLFVYFIYFVAGFMLAYISLSSKKRTRFQMIFVRSFADLGRSSWLSAIGVLIRNYLWPFERYGLFGVVVGLIYWPIVLPLTIIVCSLYIIPLTHLIFRIFCHSVLMAHRSYSFSKKSRWGIESIDFEIVRKVSLRKFFQKTKSFNSNLDYFQLAKNLILAVFSTLTVLSTMVIVTECVSYVLHVAVFTLMGIIVNAGKVLKYGTLIILVLIYSYDCYNNVYQKYLKLNKSLFSEIKNRIKEVDEVTSLPAHLQRNFGFKACEASDQGEYESEDDVRAGPAWFVNDLILFVDSEDVPRIPRRLFELVCQIQVGGAPGPVYLSQLHATGKFLVILCFLGFVFLVVLTFGDVYSVSSTNQMLATLAGGSMPFVFTNFLKPKTPDLELNSVSFKGKLQEIIINFSQEWPMFDMTLHLDDEDTSSSTDAGSSKDEDDGRKDMKGEEADVENKKEAKSFLSSPSVTDLAEILREKLTSFNVEGVEDKEVDLAIIMPSHMNEVIIQGGNYGNDGHNDAAESVQLV